MIRVLSVHSRLLFAFSRSISSLFRRFIPWKLVFKLRHAYFPAAEFHAFHFQTKALIQTTFAGNGNPASGGHNTMPGQTVRLRQRADYEPRSSRNSGCRGDSAIR
jgi:hypothetical protein